MYPGSSPGRGTKINIVMEPVTSVNTTYSNNGGSFTTTQYITTKYEKGNDVQTVIRFTQTVELYNKDGKIDHQDRVGSMIDKTF